MHECFLGMCPLVSEVYRRGLGLPVPARRLLLAGSQAGRFLKNSENPGMTLEVVRYWGSSLVPPVPNTDGSAYPVGVEGARQLCPQQAGTSRNLGL